MPRLLPQGSRTIPTTVCCGLDVAREWPAVTGRGVGFAVVLDTETTEVDPPDKVIELALVKFEYSRESGAIGRVFDAYDGLEDPGMPIPPESTTIHHITDDMVRGQRLDEAAIGRVLEGAGLVIAHNAGFDRPFVEARLAAFKALPWACSLRDVPWDSLGLGSAKLDYLAYRYGFFFEGHRAEIDCRAARDPATTDPASSRTAGWSVGRYDGVPADAGIRPGAVVPRLGHRVGIRDQGRPQGARLPLGERPALLVW
jgi:hypothetical protein